MVVDDRPRLLLTCRPGVTIVIPSQCLSVAVPLPNFFFFNTRGTPLGLETGVMSRALQENFPFSKVRRLFLAGATAEKSAIS